MASLHPSARPGEWRRRTGGDIRNAPEGAPLIWINPPVQRIHYGVNGSAAAWSPAPEALFRKAGAGSVSPSGAGLDPAIGFMPAMHNSRLGRFRYFSLILQQICSEQPFYVTRKTLIFF